MLGGQFMHSGPEAAWTKNLSPSPWSQACRPDLKKDKRARGLLDLKGRYKCEALGGNLPPQEVGLEGRKVNSKQDCVFCSRGRAAVLGPQGIPGISRQQAHCPGVERAQGNTAF